MKLDRRQALASGGAGAAIALAGGTAAAAQSPPPALHDGKPSPLTLWYRQPANAWTEALPIGNGRLGAMVFGGTSFERLQLNEDTLFAGGPYDATPDNVGAALTEVRRLIFAGDYASAEKLAEERLVGTPRRQMAYQPMADLLLLFPGVDRVEEYRRSLDLDTAVATTRFRTGSGWHSRDVMASPVDGLIAIRLTSDARSGVEVAIELSTTLRGAVTSDPGGLTLTGLTRDFEGVEGRIRFETRITVRAPDSVTIRRGDGLFVSGGKEVVLLLAGATSYRGARDVGGDPAAANQRTLAAVVGKRWSAILNDHLAEHRRLFRRQSLDLGSTPAAELPTDERIARSAELDDPALAALYQQFGRYLMISSSRPGTQPANLQGIWNDKPNPSWQSKWTLNINTEENYWLADMAALGECLEPLLRMTEELAASGRETARRMYGARGWVVHNNTDLFRQTAVVDGVRWALWPMGGAWLLSSLWDHWDYSRDPEVLRRLYPLMRESCLFYLDTLQADPATGELVTNPSLSPENRHPHGASLCAGPALDSQLLRDLFGRTAWTARKLRRDTSLVRQIETARARLPADRIGAAGQLQEWRADWDLAAPEPHHRHVSHLYALYPGQQIDRHRTPPLAAAARKSLELRGDDGTGWSIGWKLNLWASLGDGEHAHRLLRMLLEPRRTYPNMFDAHPPFQIDGNFGGAAGITRMIVQSASDRVDLLPALPAAWPTGSARGVRVRGDASVDLAWRDGALVEMTIASPSGGRFRLRYRATETSVRLAARESRRLRPVAGGRLVRA